MPIVYRFAGIRIDSTTEIAGLRVDTDPVVERRYISLDYDPRPAPSADRLLATLSGRYETRFGMLGDDWLIDSKFDGTFLIDRECRTIRIHSETDPPSAVCCDVLVRRVLPRLMSARGAVTLHAASAATGGAGLVLLGASGAGKSTTSAALAATPGWEVMSDDLSTLWPGDPATVAPSGSGVCIWQASLQGLDLDPARCAPMPAYAGKFRFDPPGTATIAPVPVRALVFLSREPGLDAPSLTPVDRLEAMALAARQIVLFNPAAAITDEYAGVIARLATIAARVKVVRLSYPARYDALPAVADLLAGLARG